jgi:pyruvate dehydrogenase E1 component alpha subunit
MLLIRAVETTLADMFARGEVPGFIHLSIGQEAVAAGVAASMGPGDTLATSHRGHGHVLARGLSLRGFFQEIMGKAGGVCQGRGGSMHVSDMDIGIIGANGIVGAGIPIALGSAMALHRLRPGAVAVVIFGDGAMAEGVLHESLNMAALMKLPLLLVCENNGWSEFSPTDKQFAASLSSLAGAFGIPHVSVDGNDVIAVHAAALASLDRRRLGEGPGILECHTTRVRGHFEGDAQSYRSAEDLRSSLDRDCIARSAGALRAASVPDEALTEMQAAVEAEIALALKEARAAPFPDFSLALADVYTGRK